MKKIPLTLLVLLFACAVHAQDITPGYEFAEEGIIYLNDKDSVQGVIAFTFIKPNQVSLVGQKVVDYKAGDIKGFYAKTSNVKFLAGRTTLGFPTFVQVVTPEYKKAMIVKSFVADKNVKTEAGKVPEGVWNITVYVVSKKANYEAYKKIAEAVKDQCPALATKITNKEEGYVTKFLSTQEETNAAFRKIIEYLEDECD